MRRLAALVVAAAFGIAASTTLALPAHADDGAGCGLFSGTCTATATRPATPRTVTVKFHHSSHGSSFTGRTNEGHHRSSAVSGGDQTRRTSAGKPTAATLIARLRSGLYGKVKGPVIPSFCRLAGACALPPAPAKPATTQGQNVARKAAAAPAPPPVPVITPQQAAYTAVAQLQLPTVAPGIGPDADKNEWKMAAVGFPLWLWADGNTHVGPVTKNVANLTVSLEAHISKMVFQMGDGHNVTCPGAGKPYAYWVRPGTKSPTCGYTYDKPSLPRGKYRVNAVAYWAVTWQVNGATGVITVPRPSSVQLPVGELQAVVVG